MLRSDNPTRWIGRSAGDANAQAPQALTEQLRCFNFNIARGAPDPPVSALKPLHANGGLWSSAIVIGWRLSSIAPTVSSMAGALECVIFIGLPAAGKSTLYQQRFADSHTHVSKDLWPNASGREARQQKLVDESFAAGKSVVIDNTNPTIADRARIISAAKARGARVIGYFFDISTRAAVARNANRTGRGKVPNVAIFTTAKRLQPPKLSEGFDELFRVELNEDRSFRTTRLTA